MGWPGLLPATELPVKEWGDAVDVLKYVTFFFHFFSSTLPDELSGATQTVVGFFNF